ncbi:hypothetical protein [Thermomonas sp.]|nr:hypothetical protein [Thermomonas sp.]HRO63786.1 hypothetical protein [Thermomonas sp.]
MAQLAPEVTVAVVAARDGRLRCVEARVDGRDPPALLDALP